MSQAPAPSDAGHPGAQRAAGYREVTASAGLSAAQAPARDDPWHVSADLGSASYYTGGAAAPDVDGDGWADLVVTRLHAPPLLFRNRSDGRFEEVGGASGLDAAGQGTVGVAFADIDNDGDVDLYFTTIGRDRFLLFVNDGTGHFTEEGVVRGAAVADDYPRQGFSAAFGDYDRDGFVDLFVCEWQWGLPRPLGASHTRLLHNRGGEGADLAGHFEDVTVAAGINLSHEDLPEGVHAFAANFSDVDADGHVDLLIAIDFEHSRLFWNRGDGTFQDGTQAAGVGTDTHGMGSALADYDADGDLDWFVTSIACYEDNFLCPVAGNRLYRNDGARTFTDVTDAAGVRDGGWGWAATFVDYDNDGWQDLAMVNGNREPNQAEAFRADPSRLWRNQGDGTFADVTPEAWDDTGDGRALLAFDHDQDGDMDLLVVDHVQGPRLFENTLHDPTSSAATGAYLQVALADAQGNREGFGAVVRVQAEAGGPVQMRELRGGSNFLGQDEAVLHFGLGPHEGPLHRVEVLWPSLPGDERGGRRHSERFLVAPNQRITIEAR